MTGRVGVAWVRRAAALFAAVCAAMAWAQASPQPNCKIKFSRLHPTFSLSAASSTETVELSWGDVQAETDGDITGDPLDDCRNVDFTWSPDDGKDGDLSFFYAFRLAPAGFGGTPPDPNGVPPDPDSLALWRCVEEAPSDMDGVPGQRALVPARDLAHSGMTSANHFSASHYDTGGIGCPERPSGEANALTIEGLVPAAYYDVYVSALMTPAGSDQNTEQLIPVRMPFSGMARKRVGTLGPPDRPLDLTAGRLAADGSLERANDAGFVRGDSLVTLTWAEPDDHGAPITAYRYRFRPSTAVTYGDWSDVAGSETMVTIGGLVQGVRYFIQVQAINQFSGEEGGSPSTVEVTLADEPVVGDLAAMAFDDGDGKAALTWVLEEGGGTSLERFEYRFHRVPEEDDCADYRIPGYVGFEDGGNVLGTQVAGLFNGATYRFEVRAVTDFGAGPVAAICYDVGRPPHPPQVTIDFIARGSPATETGHGFAFNWQPAADGGFAVTQYEYFLSLETEFAEDYPDFPDEVPTEADGRWSTICGPATLMTGSMDPCPFTARLDDLEYATEYRFMLRGENAKGKGPVNAGVVTTLPGKPDAPDPLTAVALDGAVELVWTPGADNGAEIVLFQYRYREREAGSSAAWTAWRPTAGGTDPMHVVAGLTNGVTYDFEVRAVSPAGFGESAAVSGAPVSGAALRGVVRNLEADSTCDANGKCTVTLTWQPPDGEAPTRYEWSRGDGTWTREIMTSHAVPELDAGTTYVFLVRAVTPTGGTGPPRSILVTPGTAPEAVPGVTPTVADGQVTLTWQSAGGGRGPILSYEYRFRVPGGVWSDWVNAGLGFSAEVRGLTNGVAYDFEVRARNASGGGDSTQVSATPNAGVLPGAPGTLMVEPGDGEVALGWRAALASNDDPVERYECRYRPQGGLIWEPCTTGEILPADFADGIDPNVVVVNLTNGVTYEFEVRALVGDRASEPVRADATPVVAAVAPGVPQQLVAQAGDGFASLRWAVAASNDGVAVTGYEFRWRRVGGEFGDWMEACAFPPGDPLRARCREVLEWRVDSLVNGTRVHIEVRARKGELAGPAASVWVTPGGVPDAPLDLRHSAGNGELTLAWRPPADGGSPITGYEYRVRAGAGEFSAWAPVDDRLVETGDRFTILLTGLRDEVVYTVEVRAVNEVGPGAPVTVTSTPGAVTDAALTAVAGDGRVDLRWPVSSETDAVRYEYRCTPETDNCAGWVDAQELLRREGAELVVTVEGLVNGTEYTFEVRAVGADGARAPDAVRATPAGVPGVPALTARAGDGEAVLSWRPPAADGGSAVLRYEYRWRLADGGFGTWQTAPGADSVTVGGLANGVEHFFAVRAVNAAGPGPAGLAAVTPAGAPAAPAELTAVRGNRAVTLRWRPPGDDGGIGVQRYEVRFRGVDESDFAGWTAVGSVTEWTVSGLANGVEHVFEVRAANAVFAGAAASVTAAPGAAPGAPEGLSTEVGDGRVTLRWEPPADNGGLEIVHYEVRATAPEQTPPDWRQVGLDLRAVVEGLTNGVTYVFEVRAVNAEGGGTVASVIASPWVASAPSAPVLTARADDGRVVLSWNVPANGGEAILRFEYRWRVAGEAFGDWVAASLDTGVAVDELVNGLAYDFEVRAVNGIGAGDAGTASAVPAGLPGAPTLSARAGPEEVVLTWEAPEDDGGLDILGYEYRWRERGLTFVDWRDAGLERGATARGLRNGTTYLFEVRAVNGKGAGVAATASATPASAVADTVLAEAWMARFARLNAGHVVESLQARFAAAPGAPPRRARSPRAPRSEGGDVRGRESERAGPQSERVRHRGGVGGRAAGASGWAGGGWPASSAETGLPDPGTPPRGRRADLRDLVRTLLPESFSLSATGAAGTRVSAWGQVAAGGFEGADALASVAGRVRTVIVGGDIERGALLGGVAVAHTTGDGSFRFLAGRGGPERLGDDAESTLTGLYPYARYASERVMLWGVAGSAQGSMALTGSGVDVDADVGAGLGAAGIRGVWLGAGAIEVAVKSDMLRTWATVEGERLPEVEAVANRFRLLLEGTASSPLAGGQFTSSLELGVRHDSGSVDNGGGVELGGGLRFAGARRLTLSAQGRAVLAHGADGVGEWGVSGAVVYSPRASGAGASFRLAPAFGTAASGVDRLWAAPERWLPLRARRSFGLDAQFGWGIAARRGKVVYEPYVSAGQRQGVWMRRLGWRVEGGALDVDATAFHRHGPRGGWGMHIRASVAR